MWCRSATVSEIPWTWKWFQSTSKRNGPFGVTNQHLYRKQAKGWELLWDIWTQDGHMMHCYTDDAVSQCASCRVGTSAHEDGTSNFLISWTLWRGFLRWVPPDNIMNFFLLNFYFSTPQAWNLCMIYCKVTKMFFNFIDAGWSSFSNNAEDHTVSKMRKCIFEHPFE